MDIIDRYNNMVYNFYNNDITKSLVEIFEENAEKVNKDFIYIVLDKYQELGHITYFSIKENRDEYKITIMVGNDIDEISVDRIMPF